MEIQMGGGSLNLEILRGGGLKQFWRSRWEGGKKTVPSVVGVWIFSGITHSADTSLILEYLVDCSLCCRGSLT